jgi:hypothetical protein
MGGAQSGQELPDGAAARFAHDIPNEEQVHGGRLTGKGGLASGKLHSGRLGLGGKESTGKQRKSKAKSRLDSGEEVEYLQGACMRTNTAFYC